MKWDDFEPADFEYEFENDKLAAHGVSFDEAIETFFFDFAIRRNKGHRDRYQLFGRTVAGRALRSFSS